MPLLLAVAISLHVLSATFWAGSSFALALAGGTGADRLFQPQMAAAGVAIVTGFYLWNQLHSGAFGAAEQTLSVGAVAAIAAAGIQGVSMRSARPAFAAGGRDAATARARAATAYRITAPLLALAIVCMVAARYV